MKEEEMKKIEEEAKKIKEDHTIDDEKKEKNTKEKTEDIKDEKNNPKYIVFKYGDTLKSIAKENKTIFYYPLSTSTQIEITDTTLITQLDNLEKAYSYDEQTNITQTNNDLPFIINVEAILSLKNIFNE